MKLNLNTRKPVQLPIIVMLSFLLAGCISNQTETRHQQQNLYAELGGKVVVDRLVKKFVRRLHHDAHLKELFVESDKQELQQNIADFICEISGGGCEYQGASMEDIHAGLDITEGEFDYFVTLFILTMKSEEIPFQAQNRLLAKLAAMRGDVIHL